MDHPDLTVSNFMGNSIGYIIISWADSNYLNSKIPLYERIHDSTDIFFSFFINHQDKTTTWQDPRWPAQPPKAAQHQTTHHAAAAQVNQYKCFKINVGEN